MDFGTFVIWLSGIGGEIYWIISILALFFTCYQGIAFFFPSTMDPITEKIFRPFKKRMLRNSELIIDLNKRFKIVGQELSVNDLKDILSEKFVEFNPTFELKNNKVKCHIERMGFHIYFDVILNEDKTGNLTDILFKQHAKFVFKKLDSGMNTLLENYFIFEEKKNIEQVTDRFDVDIFSNKFKFNSMVQTMGERISGSNFSMIKKVNGYKLSCTGKTKQETIQFMKDIILVATDLSREQ